MKTITPGEIPVHELQGYLQGSIGPRPIALASSVDAQGTPNLSPFSFFNLFSANPPILIFSPSRRVRDNTVKDTLRNVEATKEVVINVVNYDLVQQSSLSSTEYSSSVNEFIKSGLTMLPSEVVAPFRVKESPVQMECIVKEIISLGDQGGAGNLVICEVVKMHISESILDKDGKIDQHKIDLVSRMGGNWYSRANKGMFEVEKPLSTLGIGVDAIDPNIVQSNVFSGNDLGMLANVESLPSQSEVNEFLQQDNELKKIVSDGTLRDKLTYAKKFLEENNVPLAWKTILAK
ncbi:flavin reductase family protein [Myroides sp. LJL116]